MDNNMPKIKKDNNSIHIPLSINLSHKWKKSFAPDKAIAYYSTKNSFFTTSHGLKLLYIFIFRKYIDKIASH